MLAPVDFELRNTPALACHLVELKIALERAAATDEAAQTRSRFYRRLNARAEA